MDYDLWLILLDISSRKKYELIDTYKNSENIYNNYDDIVNSNSIISKKIKKYKKSDFYEKALRLEEELYKKEIKYITGANPLYKDKLDGILEKPFHLFYKGDIEVINKKSVAVVGARKCSNYGFASTKLLTKELITNNITLISGGARGIDSIAHKTALENDGINISVMGCGLDRTYPYENKMLFSKIQNKGVLLSEYLPGTRPLAYNFPRRNRIISGLADIVVVIEASEKSGSLITAHLALKQGKTVVAVPGSIFYDGANGSNDLLNEEGVHAYSTMESFRSLLNFNHINITPMNFTPDKSEILDILSDTPIHIDDIFRNTSVDRGALYALLFEMQIKNEIICLPGNYYVKII